MAKITTKTEVTKYEKADGTIETTSKETTLKIEQLREPDYIKLYTKMWCTFNEIPDSWQALFLQLVMRMTYANAGDLKSSQIVATSEPVGSSIRQALGWKSPDMLVKGLRALCSCGAIRRVGRAMYQINPLYAGRGEWRYNPRLERGGVEDMIALFDFKNRTVDAHILWGDNGQDTLENRAWREGLGVKKSDNTVLKTSTAKPKPDTPSQSDVDTQIDGQLEFVGREMHVAERAVPVQQPKRRGRPRKHKQEG